MMRMPTTIDKRLKQYRPPVTKGHGVTTSERYLAKLAERSFLNLWSYPSPFRNQKQTGGGDGKELCDLLVVCGRYIIIFSEKTIAWPNGELDVAWSRWVKRAVRDAAKQARGAERWITEFPDRIFLDRDCKVPFPISLPPPEDRIINRVVVAKGAAEACREHIPGSSGSLVIKPAIKQSEHWSNNSGRIEPFSIGDVDPTGSFVHVIDDVALEVVMRELDTVTDFADYLEKKANFVRSGRLLQADGEENLLAYYAIRINDEGDHDFVLDPNGGRNDPIEIDRSRYANFASDPRYIAKKQADEISYIWDALIEAFTTNMLNGTSVVLDGYDFDLKKNELGVRYMALEPRFARRSRGEALSSALEIGKTTDIFFRAMMGSAGSIAGETAFFIQTFKYLHWMKKKGGYEKYRIMRTEYAQVYAKGLLERFPHLKRVVGISCEPRDQGGNSSEDMIYAEQADWTEEDRRAIRRDCEMYEVLRGDIKTKGRLWPGQEYPELETVSVEGMGTPAANSGMNRRQRRALEAKARRSRR